MTADPTPAPSPSPIAGRHPLGTVYLFHFDQRYEHAGHYTGWAEDLDHRVAEHQAGRGARLIEVITQAGISLRLARTWPGGTRPGTRVAPAATAPSVKTSAKPVASHAAPVRTVTPARVTSSHAEASPTSSGPRRSRPAAPARTASEHSSN